VAHCLIDNRIRDTQSSRGSAQRLQQETREEWAGLSTQADSSLFARMDGTRWVRTRVWWSRKILESE